MLSTYLSKSETWIPKPFSSLKRFINGIVGKSEPKECIQDSPDVEKPIVNCENDFFSLTMGNLDTFKDYPERSASADIIQLPTVGTWGLDQFDEPFPSVDSLDKELFKGGQYTHKSLFHVDTNKSESAFAQKTNFAEEYEKVFGRPAVTPIEESNLDEVIMDITPLEMPAFKLLQFPGLMPFEIPVIKLFEAPAQKLFDTFEMLAFSPAIHVPSEDFNSDISDPERHSHEEGNDDDSDAYIKPDIKETDPLLGSEERSTKKRNSNALKKVKFLALSVARAFSDKRAKLLTTPTFEFCEQLHIEGLESPESDHLIDMRSVAFKIPGSSESTSCCPIDMKGELGLLRDATVSDECTRISPLFSNHNGLASGTSMLTLIDSEGIEGIGNTKDADLCGLMELTKQKKSEREFSSPSPEANSTSPESRVKVSFQEPTVFIRPRRVMSFKEMHMFRMFKKPRKNVTTHSILKNKVNVNYETEVARVTDDDNTDFEKFWDDFQLSQAAKTVQCEQLSLIRKTKITAYNGDHKKTDLDTSLFSPVSDDWMASW